jgi:hypothetical protein
MACAESVAPAQVTQHVKYHSGAIRGCHLSPGPRNRCGRYGGTPATPSQQPAPGVAEAGDGWFLRQYVRVVRAEHPDGDGEVLRPDGFRYVGPIA